MEGLDFEKLHKQQGNGEDSYERMRQGIQKQENVLMEKLNKLETYIEKRTRAQHIDREIDQLIKKQNHPEEQKTLVQKHDELLRLHRLLKMYEEEFDIPHEENLEETERDLQDLIEKIETLIQFEDVNRDDYHLPQKAN